MDAGDQAGPHEEFNWLTQICRAERAGAEPVDSDDDWLTELCRMPANRASNGSEEAMNQGNACAANCSGTLATTTRSFVAQTESMPPHGGQAIGFVAELTGSGSNSSVTGLAVAKSVNAASRPPAPRASRSTPYGATLLGRHVGVEVSTTGNDLGSEVLPEWRDGWAMVLRGGKCVREVAEARASRATAAWGYAEGISRGRSMIWHFPLGPPGGIEWRLMCRSAETTVVERLGRLPTIFKIGITSDPLHRWANISYGYFRDGYRTMTLVAATTPEWAVALERHLIVSFRSAHGHGCRNDAPGGESSPPDPPVFVYVVAVLEEEFARWRLARVRALASS